MLVLLKRSASFLLSFLILLHFSRPINGVNQRRSLPEKVLVGYAQTCDDKVKKAIRDGVNVVVWAFLEMSSTLSTLDFSCIQDLIIEMDAIGYNDTVHMVSLGGWNGPHFDPQFSTADDWFLEFKAQVGNIFHGIDIDFEGNDNPLSPWNYFPVETLDMIGSVFELAKEDGYIVSVAPAQSYLDIHSESFSLYVNLTDPKRDWHSGFHHFGKNVYGYLLAKYADLIDLVMVQFYESYSRAAMEISFHNMAPEAYLSLYNERLVTNKQQFYVDFEMESEVGLKGQYVELPLSKLVWGFQNGERNNKDAKHVYFPADCIQAAYQDLVDHLMEPRGFMFWVIGREGTHGLYYAKELNDILHIRSLPNQAY